MKTPTEWVHPPLTGRLQRRPGHAASLNREERVKKTWCLKNTSKLNTLTLTLLPYTRMLTICYFPLWCRGAGSIICVMCNPYSDRVILENAAVRAAAVPALAKFAARLPSLRPSIRILIKRSLLDEDDEVCVVLCCVVLCCIVPMRVGSAVTCEERDQAGSDVGEGCACVILSPGGWFVEGSSWPGCHYFVQRQQEPLLSSTDVECRDRQHTCVHESRAASEARHRPLSAWPVASGCCAAVLWSVFPYIRSPSFTLAFVRLFTRRNGAFLGCMGWDGIGLEWIGWDWAGARPCDCGADSARRGGRGRRGRGRCRRRPHRRGRRGWGRGEQGRRPRASRQADHVSAGACVRAVVCVGVGECCCM